MRRVFALLTVTGLLSAGCAADNSISDSNKRQVLAAIARQQPDLSETKVDPGGNGFTTEYSLGVTTCPPDHDSHDQVRARLRKVAHVVWETADVPWSRMQVQTLCERHLDGRPDPNSTELTVGPTAARALWGESSQVSHEEHDATGGHNEFEDLDNAELGRLLKLPHWTLFGPEAKRDKGLVWWQVVVPPDLSDSELSQGIDRIRALLWREHPERLAGIGLDVREIPEKQGSSSAASSPSPSSSAQPSSSPSNSRPSKRGVWKIDARGLRERYGPRAPDLPQ